MWQVEECNKELGISHWKKNYRTGIEHGDSDALYRRYQYHDPIATLSPSGRVWWAHTIGIATAPTQGLPAA